MKQSNCTVFPEILALLIFAHLIVTVFCYSRFQRAVKVRCCKSLFQLNFAIS